MGDTEGAAAGHFLPTSAEIGSTQLQYRFGAAIEPELFTPFTRRLICLIVDSTGALLVGNPKHR
jgi:hypothetical protein